MAVGVGEAVADGVAVGTLVAVAVAVGVAVRVEDGRGVVAGVGRENAPRLAGGTCPAGLAVSPV
ncbi:MAG: hypothetical protein QME94_15340, partial [Anaerolineae bacterium]|nr:hypothetical protein [Anaerolineae bacterium]